MDLIAYSNEINTSVQELLPQNMEIINEKSGGAIQVVSQGFEGDFMKRAIYESFAGDMYDVDRYAANATRSASAISQIEEIGVKAAQSIKKSFRKADFNWMLKNPAEGINVISKGIADSILNTIVNKGLSACIAAIGNNAPAVNDVSATKLVDQLALNGSHFKFGDRSGALIAQVMHSSSAGRLIDQALLNGAQLFTAGNVQFIDILGKKSIITDNPDLFTGTKENVMSLTSGAIVVSGASDSLTSIADDLTKDIAETIVQNDSTAGYSIKGYEYTSTKSPLGPALTTGSNWAQYVTSVKDTAGVLAIGDSTIDPA